MEEGQEPISGAGYERLAFEALGAGPPGYFAGGAGDERTLRETVEAFGRWQLRRRALVNVAETSAAPTAIGRDISFPVIVAPVAFQRLAHEDGELGMARAAAGAGTIMCLSTIATARPSEVAAAAPGAPRWFQLYCFRDRGISDALLAEAVESGFEAIALTVDAPVPGRRERDLRTAFSVPPELVPSLAATGSARPASVAEVLRLVDPAPHVEHPSSPLRSGRPPRPGQGGVAPRGAPPPGAHRAGRGGGSKPRGPPG